MRTSPQQFDLMLTFMEQHGDLTKPSTNARGRMRNVQLWEELTQLLNADGSGDSKVVEKWRKVWSDFKNNAKKKAARLHRAASGTGGGPANFTKMTEFEQRVMSIIGYQAATGLNVNEAGLAQVQEVPSEQGVEQAHSATPDIQPPRIEIEIINEPNFGNPEVDSDPPVSRECSNLFPATVENIDLSSQIETSPTQYEGFVERTAQPALSGQTTPRLRTARQRARSRRIQGSPRRARLTNADQASQHFLNSDAEWRQFRIRQHNDLIELKRESNIISKEWQNIGNRIVNILDKLVDKFCNN